MHTNKRRVFTDSKDVLGYFYLYDQGRNYGIDIGGVQMWALPQIFFLSSVADQIVKQTGQAINEWIEAYQWSGKCGNSLVCDSSSSLFSLFSGYHASYLAIILSHLNVMFFHIYSKIAAVFLTIFDHFLKKHVPPKVYGGYAHVYDQKWRRF